MSITRLWPTPTTRDYKGGYIGGRIRNGKVSWDTLDVAVQYTDNQSKTSGQLNPEIAGDIFSWKDNFFEGVPSPAGGILVLTPLIISLSGFDYIKINYDIIVPVFFIGTSFLLISKFPTYSFKKIVIQRKATIFLLFTIVLFFGLLLIYTFNVIAISSIIYLSLIPISFFHYQKMKKIHENDKIQDDDDQEDIL